MPLDDKPRNILLIRMDRIGDLILTIPVDQVLEGRHVTWAISKGLEFVLEHARPERAFFVSLKDFSFSTFFNFIREVKKCAPQEAVIFHAPWWVSLALFCAGVPIRAGKLSKWDSFLFLNQGVRQKRSESVKHEMHYNLDLLTDSLKLPKVFFESLKPLQLQSQLMDIQLKKWDLEKHQYIVVHPGMGGSALNWSMESYAKFIGIIMKNYKVVVTGSVMDRKYVSELKNIIKKMSDDQQSAAGFNEVVWLDEKLNIQELILVLKYARGVLAPSTGVIHIAASLGTPVLGLYSPKKVETALRWGPMSPDGNAIKVKTLTPGHNGLNFAENMATPEGVMERLSAQFVANEFMKLVKPS